MPPKLLESLPSWLLRIGLAFVFFYAGIDALREPSAWISYLPLGLATKTIGSQILEAFSFIQLILAASFFWKPFVPYAAAVAFLMLAGISLGNLNAMLIVFRDIGLAFMAAALVALEWPFKTSSTVAD